MQTRMADAPVDGADFRSWLPRYMELSVAKRREHGEWFVLIEDFDITRIGATSDDSLDEAFSLLEAYLRAHHEDGARFEDTLRPIPMRLKMKIRAGTIVSHVLPAARRPSERRTLVSPSMLQHSTC